MSDQLIRMDADIVCLQEIFHREALQQLANTYHEKIAKLESSEATLGKLRYHTVLHHECESIDPTHTGPSPGLGMLTRYTALDNMVSTLMILPYCQELKRAAIESSTPKHRDLKSPKPFPNGKNAWLIDETEFNSINDDH